MKRKVWWQTTKWEMPSERERMAQRKRNESELSACARVVVWT